MRLSDVLDVWRGTTRRYTEKRSWFRGGWYGYLKCTLRLAVRDERSKTDSYASVGFRIFGRPKNSAGVTVHRENR